MRGVQQHVVPVESSAYAARGLWLWGFGDGSAIQLFGDEMIGVPELNNSLVPDPAEGAAAWGREIRVQDRLPDDENPEFRARIAGKKFFGCGGPPQARCSSWGEQEDDAGLIHRGVKRVLELAESRR